MNGEALQVAIDWAMIPHRWAASAGQVVRTVEYARLACERGIAALGMTYNVDSRLAETASMRSRTTTRTFGFGPGTLSHLASLVGLAVYRRGATGSVEPSPG